MGQAISTEPSSLKQDAFEKHLLQISTRLDTIDAQKFPSHYDYIYQSFLALISFEDELTHAQSQVPFLEEKAQAIAYARVKLEITHFKGLSEEELKAYYGAEVVKAVKPWVNKLSYPSTNSQCWSPKEFEQQNELIDKINLHLIKSKMHEHCNNLRLTGGFLTRFPSEVFGIYPFFWSKLSSINISNNHLSFLSLSLDKKDLNVAADKNLLRQVKVTNRCDEQPCNIILCAADNYIEELAIGEKINPIYLNLSNNRLSSLELSPDWVTLQNLDVSNNMLKALEIPAQLEQLSEESLKISGNPMPSTSLHVALDRFSEKWIKQQFPKDELEPQQPILHQFSQDSEEKSSSWEDIPFELNAEAVAGAQSISGKKRARSSQL